MKITHDLIDQFAHQLDYVAKNWDDIIEKIAKCDEETFELLHEFELAELDPYYGYIISLKMREVRLRRRRYKDEKILMEPIKQWIDNHKSISISIFKLSTAVGKEESYVNRDRGYTPEIRYDLKCGRPKEKIEECRIEAAS